MPTKNDVGDELWETGIALFGPGFWNTKVTEEHMKKINKYRTLHSGKAHGGSVKKYAKGGGVRQARYK